MSPTTYFTNESELFVSLINLQFISNQTISFMIKFMILYYLKKVIITIKIKVIKIIKANISYSTVAIIVFLSARALY